MEEFRQVIQEPHQYARSWKKRTGQKVVGYLCTYVPEEVLYAAGMLPVRIMGSHETQDVVEPYIYSMYCPFSRDTLAQGLRGRYNYLDGLVYGHSCTHIRHTYDSWKRHIPIDYCHYVFVPSHVQSPHAQEYMVGELEKFRLSLENWTGKPISPKALGEAIQVYDQNRRLTHQLYELLKADNPPVTGAEVMEIVLASMLMDKREHSALLERFLKGVPAQGKGEGVRLMLIGSEFDDINLVKIIEDLGGRVVIDDLCVGTRYFWNEVGDGRDPLPALAHRYLSKPLCPVKDLDERARHPHLLKLAQEYRVQGVIMLLMKFCEPHEYDTPFLKEIFAKNGIPTLALETDVTIPAGQFRTRIEAYLETLRAEVLF